MSTKLPGLKNIPPKTDRELKLALEDIKQALEIRLGLRGDPLDRAVTLRELKDSGIVKVPNSAVGVTDGIIPPDDGEPGDLSTPPSPTSLTVNAAFTSIILKWNKPSYGNHGFTEIWRSEANSLGGAQLVATAGGQIYTEEVGYNQTYFYWVRFVSVQNVPSAFNDTEGTSAQTAVDVGAVLTTLGENLSNLPGYTTLTNLIDSESAVAARVIKSSSAPTTRADGSNLQANDIWYDTDDGQVHTRNGDNDDWVAARDATLVNLFGSTSFTGSTLSAAMATAQSDIVTVTNDQSTTAGNLTALTTKVDTKNKTFISSTQPANNTANDLQTGDLWIDTTDSKNQLYRWNGSAWAIVRDTTNDGKATVFTQDDVPTSGVKRGDIWFDTNDENKQYRAMSDGSDQVTSGEWEEVRDVTTQAAVVTEQQARSSGDQANATLITNLTAKVDTKNKTFISSSEPANDTTNDLKTGDLWVDSSTNNQLYRWDGSSWDIVRDTTNDGKATVFTQDNVPTSGVKKGDIWFDTNDQNKQYRAAADGSDQVTSGEWELVRDVTTQANVDSEAQARATADQAEATARGLLEAKVNKKNKTFIETSAPADNTDNDLREGDLWIDSSTDNQLYRWDDTNNQWVLVRDSTNDGKATVFTQDDVPTSGVKKGDIWFDTNDDNKQYRAAADGSDQVTSGEWEVVRDVLTQAGVTTVSNAIANGTTAEAGYGVSVNANGAVAGMYIMAQSDGTLENNTSSTNIIFEAEQVTIRNTNSGGANVQPFSVLTSTDSDGNPPGVYMTSTVIKKASIEAAQIGSLSADLVNAVAIDADSITTGTVDAQFLDADVIVSTDLANGSSTTIHGSLIETGSISANAIVSGSFISPADVGQSGSTTIHGSRIATGTIDADKINVTDLVLPVAHNKVTGTTIGTFAHNVMTVREVGSIGTKPGLYDGYVRITGSDTQVKTLSFFIGDGTFSSTGEIDSDAGTYNNAPNSQNLPMADIGGVQYHSNRAGAWAGIDRFQTAQATAQLAVTFRKRSDTGRTAKLYVLAQGDGGARTLDSVEYAFTRLAVNEPVPFTFSDETQRPTSTVHTHAAITLTGAGFTGGTLTLTGDSSAEFKINSGSYQTGSASVVSGDTFTVRMTSSSSQGTTVNCTVTINNVSDTFSITTATTGSPPGSPPPSSPPPGGPSGPIGEENP
tara:strand:+ start:3546 stop:7094 length:3549 start_codon:yes stop_codon:yes gene_type:complete